MAHSSAARNLNTTKCYELAHNTSSPTYAQSDGLGEKSVQTMKNLFEKAKWDGSDHYLAVLAHRNDNNRLYFIKHKRP